MTPEQLRERARDYPERYCQYCGRRLEPRVQTRRGRKHLEAVKVFGNRKYCSPECRNQGINRNRVKTVFSSAYVERAIVEWRRTYGLEWPYQGSEEAQLHYLTLLIEARE